MRILHLTASLSLFVGLAGSLAAQAPLVVNGLPDAAPLAVSAARGDRSLDVVVNLQEGWHLYGRDTGGGQPVVIDVVGGAFAADGALVLSMDAEGQITGEARLSLPLKRVGAGDQLRVQMRFMVCDALECLPPITLEISSGATTKVLLVGVDESERTQRIAEFLRARGFVPTVTTYAAVTGEVCDAHDVVLADSPTFGRCKGQRAKVLSFPKTTAPIVAVGFLGTELLEAQKVAMTSGYI